MEIATKYQIMDEFTLWTGEDWNAEGCTIQAPKYVVTFDDHERIVQGLRDEIQSLCERIGESQGG